MGRVPTVGQLVQLQRPRGEPALRKELHLERSAAPLGLCRAEAQPTVGVVVEPGPARIERRRRLPGLGGQGLRLRSHVVEAERGRARRDRGQAGQPQERGPQHGGPEGESGLHAGAIVPGDVQPDAV